MSIKTFISAPWKSSHKLYKLSPLVISPAPEYANSEVLLSALYRTIGFHNISEGIVPQAGKDFDKKIQGYRRKKSAPPEGATLNGDGWHTMLHGVLESPKLPNQSSKRFLQLSPLTPAISTFSGSARLSSNSWPAGALLRNMVSVGTRDTGSAQMLWADLFSALSLGDTEDVFASWLEQEAHAWGANSKWSLQEILNSDLITLNEVDFNEIGFFPARQFSKDLRAIIYAKDLLTRKQWISLVDSTIRLASASHVLWLCDVQTRIWNHLWQVVVSNDFLSTEGVRRLIFPDRPQYMSYGGRALSSFRDLTSSYLTSRLGINALLWSLENIGVPYDGDIGSSSGVSALALHIRAHKQKLLESNFKEIFLDLKESEARVLGCKKGIGSNLLEFLRHVLGQRQTADGLLKSYDQSYVLKKRSSSAASPWVVSLGPVAALSAVHCALFEVGGPRSIHRLSEYLGAYGLLIDKYDISRSDLGIQLRKLGLILDSPDAESGILLLPPFIS